MIQLDRCSFCSKHKDQVTKLIVSQQVSICSECVELCNNLLKDTEKTNKINKKLSVPDPQDIWNYLNKHVVGQDQAKIVLSVAIANHYKRISGGAKISKANILMIGPTGTGKTLMARSVAEYLQVPFVIGDATSLTEAGYVGEDVESIVARLYVAANNDISACERGIIFLDEVDKIARKGETSTIARDVSGEGVQQALLKLVEGTKCRIPSHGNRKTSAADMIEIDTSNILFIAGGAFVGLDKIVQNRVQGTAMGFSANLHTLPNLNTEPTLPDDLVRYGMIPEFVGRFTNYVNLQSLSKTQLINILTKIQNNLVDQYKWLFEQDGVELTFDEDSLDLIAEKAVQNGTGARGLHNELERVLLPHMFDLPRYRKQNILQVTINKTQVNTPMTLAQENQ